MGLFDLFGFRIVKKEDERSLNAVVAPIEADDSTMVSSNGFNHYGTHYNLDFKTTNNSVLINKYREIALQSEVESAIDEIINEFIGSDELDSPVSIDLEKVKYSDEVKEKIREEFDNILSLLNFNNSCYEIVKRFYVDGRLNYFITIDTKNPQDGIQSLDYIDPRKLKRIKNINTKKNERGVNVIGDVEEFFVLETDSNQTLQIPVDSIASVTSGVTDDKNQGLVISYLHKAIKPLNQLRMLEDATVIYRLARAPERRIFYVDVGNLPKVKAEQYLNDLMNKYRNKVVYDSETGDIKDDRKSLSMLEDFWMPRREGGRGTEISTLPGGQNLGEMEDVRYFQRKLYRSLHVPVNRLEDTSTFNTGRATEINREEVKFAKFIQRLRIRFSGLFDDLLRKQLILKQIIQPEDWNNELKNGIFYNYKKDSYFLEFNEAEIVSRRIEVAQAALSLGKKFYSTDFIRRNILRHSDEVINQIDIDNVVKKEEPEEQPTTGFGMDTGGGLGMETPSPSPEPTPEPEAPEEPIPTLTPPTPAAPTPAQNQ